MAEKAKFDPRKLMGLAIEVMRQSVSEPREDGKANPQVGVVIYKPDGSVETACRSELRNGDHAEYTLLERKNQGSRLDGSILLTTLEPCSPGSRIGPKLSCAERIVTARVKEVWVGIEDPDPTVDRKGIRFLEDRGIKVHMFDRDLQETIRSENKDFIDQALERAASFGEDKRPEAVVLSRFEGRIPKASIQDFSTEALERYRAIAKMGDAVGSESFNRRLLQQGILKEEHKKLHPTGFGLLLFGNHPREVMPQAGLLGTIHYPNGEEETCDFDGPIVLIPGLVEEWLHDKLPNIIDRSRMQRQQAPALPFELVREAVVNALVHRDYEIVGAKCQLVVTTDTITVKSPGRPVPPITLKQLQAFNAPVLSRNPQLHYVFARMDLAEERGLGMKTFKSRPAELGLPLPKYTFEDPYLALTLYRSPGSAVHALAPQVFNVLNKDERAGWECLASKARITKTEYAKQMEFDDRKAQRHLKHFVELGLLRRVGAGPASEYEVVRT